MFPSFNYDDHDNLKSSSFPSDHQNPSSSLFNFPSPFLDEHESPLNQIFFQTLHHHTDMTATSNDLDTKRDATKRSTNKVVVVEKEPLRRRSLGVVPRRRTGKKDRHSKICTAQGVRDRRMRLSLQVARKFFDLQDMLGYDKASKTIEWLFTKSKKAIKDLINHHAQPNNISISTDVKSESFLSECEVVSGSVHEDMANNNNSNKDALVQSCISPKVKDETTTIVSKSSTRESREKARARARSRTREKMMEKYLMNPSLYHEHVQKLGFSDTTPFEGVDVVSPYEPSADMGTIEKFLGHSSSSTTISWPNSGDSSAADFVGFFGNWDLLNGERSSSIFSVTNQVSLAGNPNHEFP